MKTFRPDPAQQPMKIYFEDEVMWEGISTWEECAEWVCNNAGGVSFTRETKEMLERGEITYYAVYEELKLDNWTIEPA